MIIPIEPDEENYKTMLKNLKENNINALPIKAGVVTSPVTNKTDGTVSFAYVLRTYPAGMARSFAEAKGLVISDYQNELEKRWVIELKKKYPVKINEAVLQQISK